MQEKDWILVDKRNFPVHGASAHYDRQMEHCLVIGGWNRSYPQNYLSIFCFNITDIRWAQIMINTSGICNRAYHAGATLRRNIYLFGGIISEPSHHEELTSDVVKCIETEEGYKMVVSHCGCDARKGMSACAVSSNKIILFGGSNGSAHDPCPSDLWQMTEVEDSEELVWNKLDTDGESPPGRAFHTAVAFGDSHRYMAVCGGHDGKHVVYDMWVLDMSNILFAEEHSKPKSKGKGSLCRWTHITPHGVHLPVHRCMHHCFGAGSSLYIFGGIGEYEVYDAKVHEIVFATEGNDDLKCSEVKAYANHSNVYSLHSAAIAPIYPPDKPDAEPTLVFLFGGRNEEASSRFLVLNEDNEFSGRVMKRLKELYPDPPPVIVPEIITHKQYPNGDVYDGDLIEDYTIRHGIGKLVVKADSFVYEGEFVADKRHGNGTVTFADGKKFQGTFVNDERVGHGTLFAPNGSTEYEGEWQNDVYSGQGLQSTISGDLYEGSFENGHRHGVGKLEQRDGGIYQGEWAEGKRNGRGTQKYANGDSYEGSFLADQRHGRGVCKYSNGGEYHGSWRVDKPNGYGTFISPALEEYQGKWVAGKKCGKGIFRTAHGEDSYEGLWDNDLANGQGVRLYADGSRYEGIFFNGKKHGEGALRCPDGSEYIGSFENDKRCGYGVWRGTSECRADGEVSYEGIWANDVRHGEGRSVYSSGSLYQGLYANDRATPF